MPVSGLIEINALTLSKDQQLKAKMTDRLQELPYATLDAEGEEPCLVKTVTQQTSWT